MKKILSIIFRFSAPLFNSLFPKIKNKVIFQSFPDYSDNARALSDYLLSEKKFNHYKVYWALNSPTLNFKNNRIRFFNRTGFWGNIIYIYHTITSRYLFSTHGAFSWANPKRQTFVCLWHGSPFKRIGLMENLSNSKNYLRQSKYLISASLFYRSIFADSFGRNINEILVTGYPRNDIIFKPSNILKQLNILLNDNLSLILYMPTFRVPKGGSYVDSNKNVIQDDFINFSDENEVDKWNLFFKENNIVFVVKLHPSDSQDIKIKKHTNIIILNNQNIIDKGIQLYPILYYTSALITDYSSIFCDFLLLDRPIGFITTDIEIYSKGRGFIFENPIDYLPGAIIENNEKFISFIVDVSKGVDTYAEKRKLLTPIYNDFVDSNSSKRLVDLLNM